MRRAEDPKIVTLGALPLFLSCRAADLRRAASLLDETHVRAGTALINEGGAATAFFIIRRGTASVRRADHVLAVLRDGDFFGEIALLDGGGRTASVVAETDLDLLVCDPRGFQRLLADVPTVARTVLRALSTRHRELGLAPLTS